MDSLVRKVLPPRRLTKVRWQPGHPILRPRQNPSFSCSCTVGQAISIHSIANRRWTGWMARRSRSRPHGRGGHRDSGRIVEPRWDFHQHGQSGKWVSTLFPNVAKHVDDIAFLHSMTADSPIHGSAMLMMNSGKILSGSPALGSWVNYGLGTVNENLPGFVVMLDPSGGPISGAKNWSSGYMPATYQGTVFRSEVHRFLIWLRPKICPLAFSVD